MNQTVTLDIQTARTLAAELENLDRIKKVLLSAIPLHLLKEGSDLWWEKSDKEALEQIKKGKIVKFNSVEELEKHLGI